MLRLMRFNNVSLFLGNFSLWVFPKGKTLFLFKKKEGERMMHDLINDALVGIKNREKRGKGKCVVKPLSNLLIEILKVFQKEGYIGEFEVIKDERGGKVEITLKNCINDCGVIKPRFAVKKDELPKWEKRFLPARDFGVLVMTTPKGVMTQKEAISKNLGGRLLAYVY